MNGIEKIIQRIAAEAEAESLRITGEADERCAAIAAEFENKAAAAYEEAMAKGRQEIEQLSIRADRAARLDAKKEILSQKQALVQAAFDSAKEKLLALSGDEYVDFLAGLAAKAALSGKEELILSAKDAASVGQAVIAKANAALKAKGVDAQLKLSGITRDITSGFIMKSGNVEVNCTADALLEQSRGELESKVTEIFFG